MDKGSTLAVLVLLILQIFCPLCMMHIYPLFLSLSLPLRLCLFQSRSFGTVAWLSSLDSRETCVLIFVAYFLHWLCGTRQQVFGGNCSWKLGEGQFQVRRKSKQKLDLVVGPNANVPQAQPRFYLVGKDLDLPDAITMSSSEPL